MSIDTKNQKELITREINHLGWTDNPTQQLSGINQLRGINENIQSMCRRHNIFFASYDLLVRITTRWLMDGTGSTVYGITNGVVSVRTKTHDRVNILLARGLVDIIGSGQYNAVVYAPSKLALSELNNIVGR